MRTNDPKQKLPIPSEHVKLQRPIGRGLFRLLSFLLCAAILVAAFAVSGIWSSFSAPVETFLEGLFHRDRVTDRGNEAGGQPSADADNKSEVPQASQNAIPVVAVTLTESNPAKTVANEEPFRFESTPAVLIYCANPKEAYLPENKTIVEGMIGETTFSTDPAQTVCAGAKTLLNILDENGVSAFYAEPEEGEGYLGSSARAADLVQKALSEHPEISLVIAIGRDSLFDAEGNYIKTVIQDTDDPAAQVLAIVGSGASGSPCPSFQNNLDLARTLQAAAEEETPGLFRGIRVKSTPQSQQFAPISLSLLVGSGANSVAEAEKTVQKIAAALLSLFSDF